MSERKEKRLSSHQGVRGGGEEGRLVLGRDSSIECMLFCSTVGWDGTCLYAHIYRASHLPLMSRC